MLLQELLESTNTPIIVVDVQPSYEWFCNRIAPKICEMLNASQGPKKIFFNGLEMTSDSKYSVIRYLQNHGLNTSLLHNIDLQEKEFGYFRNWMDENVKPGLIIQMIRTMYTQRVHSTDDLDENILQQFIEKDSTIASCGPMWLPENIFINDLRKYNNGYICGGSYLYCLKEISLLMNAFNIRHKILSNMIY